MKYKERLCKITDPNIWIQYFKNGKIVKEEALGHNVATGGASLYVAGSLVAPDLLTSPIKYLAMGRGSSSWDPENPPAETKWQTRLEDEIVRKEVDWSFVSTDGTYTRVGKDISNISNIIEVWADFTSADFSGETLMELGLFANCQETPIKDDGFLINYRTFPRRRELGFERFRFVVQLRT